MVGSTEPVLDRCLLHQQLSQQLLCLSVPAGKLAVGQSVAANLSLIGSQPVRGACLHPVNHYSHDTQFAI